MNVGPIEIVIVLVLALLVFGPKRLPQMGRTLGRGVREFKNAATTARTELGLDGITNEITEVKSTITDLKSSVDLKSAVEAPVTPEQPAATDVATEAPAPRTAEEIAMTLAAAEGEVGTAAAPAPETEGDPSRPEVPPADQPTETPAPAATVDPGA